MAEEEEGGGGWGGGWVEGTEEEGQVACFASAAAAQTGAPKRPARGGAGGGDGCAPPLPAPSCRAPAARACVLSARPAARRRRSRGASQEANPSAFFIVCMSPARGVLWKKTQTGVSVLCVCACALPHAVDECAHAVLGWDDSLLLRGKGGDRRRDK